jgi:hypothetical protein
MKTKLQMTFATLALSMGLLLPAAAQQYEQVKPKPQLKFKVPLGCKASGYEFSELVIATNTSAAPLKQGTVIYYTTNLTPRREFTLAADLAVGKTVHVGTVSNLQSCQAWFLK